MIRKDSPAKLNLYLRVLRKRPDGYHDILSLMQRISLSDEMTFSHRGGGIVLKCPGTALPEDEGNIIHRAASAFLNRIAASTAVEITLLKRIPVAAGLGGGSSNAATTLVTLNEMFENPLSRPELMTMGAGLGADVPFFIHEETAWASGIGDRLSAAPPLPPFWYVLVNPGFEVSTKWVYQGLNLGLTNEAINYSIPRFYTQEELIRGLLNDLENVTIGRYPVLNRIKNLLLESGAGGALMSGSGPTVFGVFTDERSARSAEALLTRAGRWSVFRAHSL